MRRFVPAIAVTISTVLAIVLVGFFIGVFFALPSFEKNVEHVEHNEAPVQLSLAPPSFLLRLSLFPEGRKQRSIVGVMIENSEDARLHQEGLDKAVFIQEFFVEGMISRFLAFFDREDLPASVGPVRSLRPYFVDASQPWVGGIVHAGGSPEAFERATAYGDLQTVNVLHFDDDQHVLRRNDVAPPHNLFLTQESFHEFLPQKIPTVTWPPYPTGGPPMSASGASIVRINFLSSLHNVAYRIDADGTYRRTAGGTPSASRPRNVLVLQMPITEIGEFGRLTIPVTGEGELLLFRSGYVIPGLWRKTGESTGLEFFDMRGGKLVLAAGPVWMTVVPEMWRVEWE